MKTLGMIGSFIAFSLALLIMSPACQGNVTAEPVKRDASPAAFKASSEPDGFRGFKWGTALARFSDMADAVAGAVSGRKVRHYTKSGDDTQYGPVRANRISYIFCEDKFYGVDIDYTDIKDAQWNLLAKWLLDQYGEAPELVLNGDPAYIWWGDKSFVRLQRSLDSCYLTIWSQFFFPDSKKPASVFERAVELGDVPQLTKMLEANPGLIKSTGAEGKTPLFWSLNCHPKATGEKVVEYLVSKGADVNGKAKDGTTPLQRACQLNQLPMVKLLVSKGADVNLKGWGGETPLVSASSLRPEIAIYLIEQGADVRAKDDDGKTALLGAAEWGYADLVKLLVAKGADVNAKDKNGWSPLHASVMMTGKHEVVRMLIEAGARVDAKEEESGKTPLHVAAEEYRDDAVKLLLQSGADVNAKDSSGSTPLQYAIDSDVPAIAEIIRQHGGK